MIRFLLRAVGLLLLALAFILAIYDGTKSIAGQSLLLTKGSELWAAVHNESLQVFQTTVERYADLAAWQIGVQLILKQPAFVVPGALGVVFTLLGRKKKPLIGYAND